MGVAAAGGFEPSQAIKAVTPKARQMIWYDFHGDGCFNEIVRDEDNVFESLPDNPLGVFTDPLGR